MPSQIPLELRAHLRDVRAFGSEIEAPEHMNVVSAEVGHNQVWHTHITMSEVINGNIAQLPVVAEGGFG